MSLTNFLEDEKNKPRSLNTGVQSTGSLANFLQQNTDTGAQVAPVRLDGGDIPAPRTVDDARKIQKEDPTMWQRISKELQKSEGLAVTAVEQTADIIVDVARGDFKEAGHDIISTPKKFGGILTGTRERSFQDLWEQGAEEIGVDKRIGTVLGLIVGITSDPLNFIGGGYTKLGTVTNKVQKLNKAGETIKDGSKLHNELKSMGLLDDVKKLKLGATRAEQVQMGQRAVLSFMAGTRWEKKIAGGARYYDEVGKVGKAVGGTKAAQVVGKVFSTKTTNEAFNVAKRHANDLLEYRKGEVMTQALKIQNQIGKLSKADSARIVDLIETAGGKQISVVDDTTAIASTLQNNFDIIRKSEEKAGLLKTDIQDYFPHIKVDGKEQLTSWQKFKSAFQKADGGVDEKAVSSIGSSKEFSTDLASSKHRTIEGTVSEINKQFGTKFFKDKPAVVFAQRALGSAKAVTSKEFFGSVKEFGVDAASKEMQHKNWIDAKGIKELEGLKFSPDVAAQLTAYNNAIRPEELKKALKIFDGVQNWWKAQALVAPSYHVRNFVGNMWNNFLADVTDPRLYVNAGKIQKGKTVNFVDEIGRKWDNGSIVKAAKQSGVLNDGWYAKDIDVALSSEMAGSSWNPIKQNFGLFKANRAAGTVLENNARLAHFIDRLKKGHSIDDASSSVKKYLFDYGDLTPIEKGVFKRAMPFYTWTRKNIPLQLDELFKNSPLTGVGAVVGVTEELTDGQDSSLLDVAKAGVAGAAGPGSRKFAGVAKTTRAIESNVEKPNEKYLGDYIRDNVGVRVGTDEKGNTFYFLMGNWLPAAQAIDFMSQPIDNFIMMLSPFMKAPVETWANQSSFFKDTFGQPSQIERYPEENQSWLGFTMRKKTANILKNIRVLNELDKLNPGTIFGDKNTPSLVNRIAPEAGVRFPLGIGSITTSEKRGGRFTPDTSQGGRVLQSLFGKTSPYNPSFSRKFYMWDTDTKVRELNRAIKDARRDGQKSYAKRLQKELRKVRKERR